MRPIPTCTRPDGDARALDTQARRRRAFLLLGSLAILATAVAPGIRGDEGQPWPKVPAVDASKVRPADFTDDELDLPFYLAHFHELANGVVETGADRGFIGIRLWRNPRDNQPYNARIMENILSLSFFYATDRPWNPYFASPAVRARLEAGLDFWCRIQSPEGLLSEYKPQGWNLAATAFATKFMGGALTLLEAGPRIDPALLARVVDADRRAVRAVLTRPDLYEHGRRFSNQYTNVFAGGFALLALHPDPELQALLEARIAETHDVFQSPAGYFYENRGADWGYNLSTHHSNLRMAIHYARGTKVADLLIEEERRFVDWLSFNAALEPDDSGFTLNRGIETRQRSPFLARRGGDQRFALPPEVALGAAFLTTRGETERDLAARRLALERQWPLVPALSDDFATYSPYTFLHRRHPRWTPTEGDRKRAVARLPYLARRRFSHQRADSREPVVFTYLRRPGYYAAFNSGRQLTEQQRYGLGLVWNPVLGSLLQSQTSNAESAWGTRAETGAQVYEAGDLAATIMIGDRVIEPRPGRRDLPSGRTTIRYPLAEAGAKQLSFKDRSIAVSVTHGGGFCEKLPLLAPMASVRLAAGKVSVKRNGATATITFTPALVPTATEAMVDGRPVVTVTLPARDRLDYSIEFEGKGVAAR